MDNITVIKQKTLAKQRGIKGYYQKSWVDTKIGSAPASFNTGVRNTQKHNRISEYQRNFWWSNSDDKTSVLQPAPNFIAKSIQKINNFGNWLLNYISPKPKVVDEALELFKNLIKKLFNKRDTSFHLKGSKSAWKSY